MRQGAQGWCTGMTLGDGMAREVVGAFWMGNTCVPVADSCQCMAKPVQYCKVKESEKKKKKKNTGVDCHFLLQRMKVKSESEVAQLCLTPIDLTDCSPPGSSIHGVFQARVLEWGAIAFSIEVSRHIIFSCPFVCLQI